MNRAKIAMCHGCWAHHEIGPDQTPVTKPGQKWVITDVGMAGSVATLHEPYCLHLPGNDLLAPGRAPEEGGDDGRRRTDD